MKMFGQELEKQKSGKVRNKSYLVDGSLYFAKRVSLTNKKAEKKFL